MRQQMNEEKLEYNKKLHNLCALEISKFMHFNWTCFEKPSYFYHVSWKILCLWKHVNLYSVWSLHWNWSFYYVYKQLLIIAYNQGAMLYFCVLLNASLEHITWALETCNFMFTLSACSLHTLHLVIIKFLNNLQL